PEGGAVVELHVRAELHLPGRVVQALPGQRETRAYLAGLEIARGQVVEDVVTEDDALAEHRVGGIPVLHVALQRVDDRVVLGLGRDIGGSEEGETEQESESQRDGTSHDVLLLTALRVVGGGSGGAHRRSSAGTIAACPRAVKAPQMSQEACQESRPPGGAGIATEAVGTPLLLPRR